MSWPPEWKTSAGAKAVDAAEFTAFDAAHPPAGVLATKGERAGIRRSRDGGGSGPTGAAWVDSNGWKIRLSRQQNAAKSIWVESDAPKADEVLRVENYLVAMADSAAYGGQWVISLAPDFRSAIAADKPEAAKDWQRIRTAAKFFAAHAAWANLPARAELGVLSDYAGENEYLAGEILNLAARQQIPYAILETSKFSAPPAGLKAIVYADAKPPAAPVRAALEKFAAAGGLLIAAKAWGAPASTPLPGSPAVGYSIYPSGKGRIALANEFEDPYLVAADAQILLSHRNDVVRMFNGGSIGMYPTGDAKRTVVHLVNYSGRPGADDVSLWVAGTFSRATLYSLENAEPKPLKLQAQRGGAETYLPPVPVYAAVELS